MVTEEVIQTFYKTFVKNEMLFQLLDSLPLTVEIFTPEGESVYLNHKLCEVLDVVNPNNFNILKDEYILDKLGLRELVEGIFKGKTLTCNNIKSSLEVTNSRCPKKSDRVRRVYWINALTGFPIFNKNNKIAYVVVTCQIDAVYKGREEIIKAQEYMNEHWKEKFNIIKISKNSNFSREQFYRLFKQHTGKTPYEYYKHIKIDKLKKQLCNPETTVSKAFLDCGLEYKSNYKQFFKEIVGMTPSEYQKKNS